MNRPTVTNIRPAGAEHRVVSVEGGRGGYRRRPCGGPESTPARPGCPWRTDAVGHFPPEAFVHSAHTAYDLNNATFACHESGTQNPTICAGFLLRGADHNMAVRRRAMKGEIDPDGVDGGGHELHADYRAMAEANGVPADHPALAPCRGVDR